MIILNFYTFGVSDHFDCCFRDVIEYTPFLHLRYDKTDCALMCSPEPCDEGSQDAPTHGDFYKAFTNRCVGIKCSS